ncbi:MAG TPA: hypothetical protein PLU35_00030 [Phycisphaerales bacterium]|nr:hypothetical protein [Phycisphaerales bacterium]
MKHSSQDRVSFEIARLVAAGLSDHPEWIETARENLRRWKSLNRDAPGLLRCYDEWEAMLDLPPSEIASRVTEATDEGQRLRQNSPFAGVLPASAVWDIKRRNRSDPRQDHVNPLPR